MQNQNPKEFNKIKNVVDKKIENNKLHSLSSQIYFESLSKSLRVPKDDLIKTFLETDNYDEFIVEVNEMSSKTSKLTIGYTHGKVPDMYARLKASYN